MSFGESGCGPRHSSNEFLLSIQFIGQLGPTRTVLWRVFSQRHDYSSLARSISYVLAIDSQGFLARFESREAYLSVLTPGRTEVLALSYSLEARIKWHTREAGEERDEQDLQRF